MIKHIYPLMNVKVDERGLSLTGPFSPVMAAKEICNMTGLKLEFISRIYFDKESIMQEKDGNEITCYDQICLVNTYRNDKSVAYFIDMGVEYCPVCLYFENDKELTVAPIYEKIRKNFIIPLTDKDLEDLCKLVLSDESNYLPEGYKEAKEKFNTLKAKVNGKET